MHRGREQRPLKWISNKCDTIFGLYSVARQAPRARHWIARLNNSRLGSGYGSLDQAKERCEQHFKAMQRQRELNK